MSKMSICPNTKCEHVDTCSLSKPHTYEKPVCNGCDIGDLHCPPCVDVEVKEVSSDK